MTAAMGAGEIDWVHILYTIDYRSPVMVTSTKSQKTGTRLKAKVLGSDPQGPTRSCALCADEVGGALPGPRLPWDFKRHAQKEAHVMCAASKIAVSCDCLMRHG